MRVAVVLPDLRCGGIQRAALTVAHELADRKHEVTILTLTDDRSDFFATPPGLARLALNLRGNRPAPPLRAVPRTLAGLIRLRAALLALCPQVVIAHSPTINVHALLALRATGIPVIATEHGDVAPRHWKKALWYRLRRTCYGHAFKVVSVSEAVDCNVGWLSRERRVVIHNPITLPSDTACSHASPSLETGAEFVASMGRLSHAKGFDILLDAFARIARNFPSWQLLIIGDGELREVLQRQAQALGIAHRVLFTGALRAPFEVLRCAKFFVMASRFEGFPLAHGEALACGLPVIATDCPSRPAPRRSSAPPGGVRELIRRDVDGVLTPCEDPAALAGAMAELMSDPVRRSALARRAVEVAARFSPHRIADAWEALLGEAARTSMTAGRFVT